MIACKYSKGELNGIDDDLFDHSLPCWQRTSHFKSSTIDVVACNINHVTNMKGNKKLLSLSQLILPEPNCWKSTNEVEGSKGPTLYLLLTTKS